MARHNAVGPLALWLMIISLGLLAVALWLLFADEAKPHSGSKLTGSNPFTDKTRLNWTNRVKYSMFTTRQKRRLSHVPNPFI